LGHFEKNLNLLKIFPYQVDVGVFQETPLKIDHEKTLKKLQTFWNELDLNKSKIIKNLIEFKPTMILYDNSAIAPLIGKELQIPVIAITNFTWDNIYDTLSKSHEGYKLFSQLNKLSHSRATLVFKQPFSHPMPAFKTGIQTINASPEKIHKLVWKKIQNKQTNNPQQTGIGYNQKILVYQFWRTRFT
jgi:hypothetical protein